MQKFKYSILLAILFLIPNNSIAGGGLVAFYSLGTYKGSLNSVKNQIVQVLEHNEFRIIGNYHPENNNNMLVITFTDSTLIDICSKIKDRGLMAAVMRIGLIKDKNGVLVSLLNPDYLFYAYLRDNGRKYELNLNKISLKIKMALSSFAKEFKPYIASSLSERAIKEFRFTVYNPAYDDIVIIRKFPSFEQGIRIISENLQARKEGSIKVYQLIDTNRKIAVFGVGLLDRRRGESVFLPKLGISHIAALPYELVLENKTASILNGKYRFPLYWSDLNMVTFRKIYKSPRDVAELMKALCR